MNSNVISIGSENQYQIFLDKQIGEGSFGKVYDCVQINGNRATTIKLCAKITQVSSQPNSQKNTLREEQILKIVKDNPFNFNIVKVEYVQFFEKEAKLVVIMEKCDMNLKQMLIQKQTFSSDEIFDFLQQFIAGYKPLSNSNIIHRDIKPENILIKKKFNGEPQYKLADFGVGKIYKQNDFVFTRVGTPIYSAPEISSIYRDPQLNEELSTMKNKKSVIDMYSLGIILYQLTFCGLPFPSEDNGNGIVQFFQRIKVQPFKPPTHLGKNQEILNLIENLLIYNPSRRLNFDYLYQKYFTSLRTSFKPIINGFSPNEAFQEVKQYLQKYLILSQNFLDEQQKKQIAFVLQQQQWNQTIEWVYNCFSFQPQNSQLYNEQDLSFFICLWSLKNKQSYVQPKNKEQMIAFLSK